VALSQAEGLSWDANAPISERGYHTHLFDDSKRGFIFKPNLEMKKEKSAKPI